MKGSKTHLPTFIRIQPIQSAMQKLSAYSSSLKQKQQHSVSSTILYFLKACQNDKSQWSSVTIFMFMNNSTVKHVRISCFTLDCCKHHSGVAWRMVHRLCAKALIGARKKFQKWKQMYVFWQGGLKRNHSQKHCSIRENNTCIILLTANWLLH